MWRERRREKEINGWKKGGEDEKRENEVNGCKRGMRRKIIGKE